MLKGGKYPNPYNRTLGTRQAVSVHPRQLPNRRRGWLWVDEVLCFFGADGRNVRSAYGKFVLEGIGGDFKNPLEEGRGYGIIGKEDFIEGGSHFLRSRAPELGRTALRRIVAQVEPERIIEVVCSAGRKRVEEEAKKDRALSKKCRDSQSHMSRTKI